MAYVHIGPKIPPYLTTAIDQARLFNPDCPIYVIANETALAEVNFKAYDVTPISCESLKKSPAHEAFIAQVTSTGLWRFAMERFFYLDDLVQERGIKNLFHTENDVMIYANLEEQLPLFQKYYNGMIAAPFDDDERCIPSFLYIFDSIPLAHLAQFIAERAPLNTTDMALLSDFKNNYRQWMDHLPVIFPSYKEQHPLINFYGKTPRNAADFSNHFEAFAFLFDAAAIGQYLGGIDPNYFPDSRPGFINERAYYNPAFYQFEWKPDELGRQTPYLMKGNEPIRIMNLHIHCKNLEKFYSLNTPPSPPHIPLEKIFYPFSAEPIDAVIVCSERDRNMLDACIRSVKENVLNIHRIIVVSKECYSSAAEWFDLKGFPFTDTSVLDEIFKFNPDRLASRRFRYLPRNQLEPIYHQLLKLYSPVVIPNLSSNVLAIDARTHFLDSFACVSSNGEPVFFAKQNNTDYALFGRFLPDLLGTRGFKNENSNSFLFQRPVIKDLLEQLGKFHHLEAWQGICRSLSSSYLFQQPPFSEYDLYHRFFLLRSDQGTLGQMQGIEIRSFEDSSRYRNQGLTYIQYKN